MKNANLYCNTNLSHLQLVLFIQKRHLMVKSGKSYEQQDDSVIPLQYLLRIFNMFVRTRILQNDAIDLHYEPDDASAGDLPSLLMISFFHFLPTALSPETNQNSLAIGHYAQKILNLYSLTDANSSWLGIQGFEYEADFF